MTQSMLLIPHRWRNPVNFTILKTCFNNNVCVKCLQELIIDGYL